MDKEKNKFLLVSVNMGYGHQRTAFPLKEFAHKKEILQCNDYEGIPEKDKKIWQSSRNFYELISRLKKIPFLGEFIFSSFDKVQEIEDFYPKRDLSTPNFMVKRLYKLFEKGWGKDFIDRHNSNIPMINTFFVSAFMAEYFNYKGEIYCIVCDADISRSWVSMSPKKSRIKYFASNSWTKNRLKMYGIKEENIFLTGYPLPTENIGENSEILKEDLKKRILNLDIKRNYIKKHISSIEEYLGNINLENINNSFTIAFSIGGAGAQKEIAIDIIKSIKNEIKKRKINIRIMAGIRKEVKNFFEEEFKKEDMNNLDNIKIIYDKDINNYFKLFNKEIKNIDILWTKPSELSFYTALGIPLLLAPTIGSQEDFNKRWLLRIGSCVVQENTKHAKDWLFDYLESGRFADFAMRGFIYAENRGTYNIINILNN